MKRFACYYNLEMYWVCLEPLAKELERRGWQRVAGSEPRDVAFILLGRHASSNYRAMSPLAWLPHGLAPAKWVFPSELGPEGAEMPDLLLLPGPFYARRLYREPIGPFRRQLSEHIRFIIVGWPKMDALFSGGTPRVDLPHPVILFAPTWGRTVGVGEFVNEVRAALADLGTLIVVPHPGLKWEFGATDVIHTSDIRPYLAVADVVVSDQSSVAIEAACLDKPVVHLLEHWSRRGWSEEDGEPFLVGHAATLATLRDDVEDALAHPGRHSFLRRYWAQAMLAYPGEGAKRAADAIEFYF